MGWGIRAKMEDKSDRDVKWGEREKEMRSIGDEEWRGGG